MSESVTRILIVEDESIVALDLQSLLKRLGFEVCGREATGEGALKRALEERPDLILMDVRLAGEMDGISSAEAIRKVLDLPVIFLTAYADRETVERAKASDAYGYLLKPFQEREIEIAIDMAMYKHETQKRLERQEALLDATLESIPDAVFTLDQEDRIVLVNEAVITLLGKDERELLGRRFAEAVPLSEVEPETARKGALGSWVRIPGGPLLELRRRELEAAEGGRAAVVVLRDISLQAAYEEQMESARRAAEEASKAKSEFIANMSHELRTPMNSILGMSELAMDIAEREEQREYLSIVRRSAEELQGLISNVLDFSRIESDSAPREEHPFQLDELLEEIAQRQMPRAHRKGLYLLCHIDPETPLELLGERESLASVLVNLISNGLKFSREGGVTLSASPVDSRPEEVTILFEVADTGIGISDADRNRVFEPFTQLDPSATRDYGGTGLGLALVRKLTERLGGEIRVTSAPGEGTTVRLSLELRRNRAATELLSTKLTDPPELLIWGEPNGQLQTLLPWLERWGVPVEAGITFDSLLSRESQAPAILLASPVALSGDPEAFSAAVRSGSAAGAILIGEAEALPSPSGVHVLGEPPRLRHLRRILEELTTNRHAGAEREREEPLSLLVVDDQTISRVTTEKLLRAKGHRVRSVSGGIEAIEELKADMADVVLLDLEMPDLDGWETTLRIRREVPRGGECAIIAITGHTRDAERERARIVGMDEFLSKPVGNEQLDRAIRATVVRREHANRLREASESRGRTGPGEIPPARSERGGAEAESVLRRAREALEAGACEKAEPLLVEYRGRCGDSKERDSVFKAVLACRRHDPEGALLRLDGIGSGG